jgi:hypothetical protein
MVVVGEDTALITGDKTAGSRGLIGTILTNKVSFCYFGILNISLRPTHNISYC